MSFDRRESAVSDLPVFFVRNKRELAAGINVRDWMHTNDEVNDMRRNRTDLAYEEVLNLAENDDFTHHKKSVGAITAHHIVIHRRNDQIDKEPGEYITVELTDLNDQDQRDEAAAVMTDCLKQVIFGGRSDVERVLVVGLGNQEITADALGPMAAREVIVTSHLFRLQDPSVGQDMREVAVIVPGVMGQTGMETAEFVQAVARQFQPDLVIAIDALGTRSLQRINRVIQISDTGIQPGGGVGNHRKAINEALLGVPVIAVGVATVVSIEALIDQVLSAAGSDDYERIMQHIHYHESYQMVLTPKEMDEEVRHLSEVIARSLNQALHPRFDTM